MKDYDKKLEKKHQEICQKIAELESFRRGSVTENYRKCGKKNCACVKPGHPGHGPQYIWTTTIDGKTISKSIPVGPQLQKYLEETDRYREFKQLCKELTEVNEKLCDLRSVPVVEDADELADIKKKLLNRFREKSKKK